MRHATAYRLTAAALFMALATAAGAERMTPAEQKAWEDPLDIRNIRADGAVMTDTSPDFIAVPADYADTLDFTVASTPPTITFSIVHGLEPSYLSYRKEDDYHLGGAWGGWGDVTRGAGGRFYFSIGNHMSYQGTAYVIEYDPATGRQRNVFDLRDIVGWTPDEYADGKLHGDLDVAPDGECWTLSYFGPGPRPWEWRRVYRGGRLIHFNTLTGEAEDLGIPLEGESWPYSNWDRERGLLFGVSHDHRVIAYDTDERRMLYGGAPPGGIQWNGRCTMIDHDTGHVYCTSPPDGGFVRYERRNNTFTRMEAHVPPHPASGKRNDLRAHTTGRDADGAFWCIDGKGLLFRFFPDEDHTEAVGVNWGREGYYTPNLCMSPGGRYLYYLPGTYAEGIGVPLVQYDTRTGAKKVICFTRPWTMERCNYAGYGAYGLELSADGGSILFYVNGGFWEDGVGTLVRRPAFFHVVIPESERRE